jgi:hypothetical protein
MPTQQPYESLTGPNAPPTLERAVSLTKAAVYPLARLQPPTLDATGQFVSGKDIERLRLQNKQTRHTMQEQQVQQSMWRTHTGTNFLPNPTPLPQKWCNKMCSSGIATSHPAGELLQELAQMGRPTKMGCPWSKDEMWEAVKWGPHRSAFSPEALKHFAEEAIEKVAAGQA